MSQQEQNDKSQHFYRASAADFMKIPGSPLTYWAPRAVGLAYDTHKQLYDITISDGQNITADNDKFLRLHHEVDKSKIGVSKKWVFYCKGGAYRKWYGNIEYVVNWSEEAKQSYRRHPSARIIPEYLQFRDGVTWTLITSSKQSYRYLPNYATFDKGGSSIFFKNDEDLSEVLMFLNSHVSAYFTKMFNSTLNLQVDDVRKLPFSPSSCEKRSNIYSELVRIAKYDWDLFETSWGFSESPILNKQINSSNISDAYRNYHCLCRKITQKMLEYETDNNEYFVDLYNLGSEISSKTSINDVTLLCNPVHRYGGSRSNEELTLLQQCDTTKELLSYVIGCMMGRYSIDKPGLILASHGETLQDYLNQIPNPRFMPDSDAILPLTDQEWFADDVTNRVREFVKVVWGEETLQENLAFIAESLCLHAIKPLSTKNSRGEGALDTIRRYLSTQFYKDHLKTYKKRPIYWLFSSGKEKAFECLVYLHRYNESTLARMRTEYVTPLMGKYDAQHSLLLEQKADASPAQQRELEKELKALEKKQTELRAFDEQLKHHADMRIKLDLDDGVKVNYGKFGNLLTEVKAVTGDKG